MISMMPRLTIITPMAANKKHHYLGQGAGTGLAQKTHQVIRKNKNNAHNGYIKE